jgi:hypothetical protein
MKKQKNIVRFVAANFVLQKDDFWQMALVSVGLWAVAMVGTGIAFRISHSNDILGIDIAGIISLAFAVLMGFVASLNRFWIDFKVGVQMSISRRRMWLTETVLCLAGNAMMLMLALLGNAVWRVLYASRVPQEDVNDLLASMPKYVWLLAWLLPIALGMICIALVTRFGHKAGWLLYALFLALCYSPSALESIIQKNNAAATAWSVFKAYLPFFGAALTVAAFAAGTWMLLRESISN